MNKKQITSHSLPRLPSLSDSKPHSRESKLFKTREDFNTTSKLFLDRFNAQRDLKTEEDGPKKGAPRSMIQRPLKLSMGFTPFWTINKEETGELVNEMRKMKSKSTLLQPSLKAEILFNQIEYEKIRKADEQMMEDMKAEVARRLKEMTPYQMKKEVKKKDKFKNKVRIVREIILSMNYTIYEDNLNSWKPYFDYDSLPVPVDNSVYFIGGRKHCPIVSFNVAESRWSESPPISNLKPFGECPATLLKDSKVMCFGGYSYFQQGFSLCSNSLKIIDLHSKEVEIREFSETKVGERAFHSQCIYGEFLIVSGGMDKNSRPLKSFMNYNFEKNYWNELSIHKMPPELKAGFAKHQSLSVFHRRKTYSIYNDEPILQVDPNIKEQGIYIFGGEDSNAGLLSKVYIVKLGSPSVVISEAKIEGKGPIGRRNARMVRLKEFLVIHGGRNDEMNPFVLNSIHFLSLRTMSWIKVSGEKPPYRYSHSLSVVQGDIVILGGKNTEGLCKEVYVMPMEEVIEYV